MQLDQEVEVYWEIIPCRQYGCALIVYASGSILQDIILCAL